MVALLNIGRPYEVKDMKQKAIIATFLIALIASLANAQERYVKPQDEAAKDPSFLAFRTKLIAAAERKDTAYLLSIVDRRIKNGFGGQDGIANFKRDVIKKYGIRCY